MSKSPRYSPSKTYANFKKLNANEINNLIDNWPAHALGRTFASSQIAVANGRLRVLSEAETKLPNLIPKPRFLEKIESKVKRRLESQGLAKKEPCMERLHIYREAFDFIINSFKSYAPLLSSIKHEYDEVLNYYRLLSRDLQPTKELVWTVAQDCDAKINEIQHSQLHDLNVLRQQVKELETKLSVMKEEKTELKFLMEKLKIDMAKLEELRRTEADGRKLGIISINQLQMQLADMRHSFQESMRTSESQDDPVKMKIALQKAKEAHTFLLTKLTQMETDYVDVVPRKQFEEASEKMKIMGEDLEVLSKHCKALQSTLEDQHKVLEETIEQKNEVDALYTELKRSSTPRPAWRDAVCSLPGGKKYWKQLAPLKSSKERLQALLREFLNESEGENRSSRGTDSAVPTILRSSEPVLQRALPIRDLLLLVEDIWTKRKTQLTEFLDKCAPEDGSEQPSLPSFDEFLANYFQTSFGLPTLRREWAYALYNSADYYSECDELVQLRKIIDNQMDEAYHWYLDSLIRRAFNKLKQLAHATAIASTVPDNEKPETPGAKTTLSSKRKVSRQLSILTPENLQTCLSRLLQCDAKQAAVVELVRCAFTDHRSVPDEEGANESVVVISPDATVSVEGLFAKKPGQPQPDFVNLLVERLEAERKATINHIIMELQRHKRSSADANYVELPELLEALRSVRPEYEKLLAFSSTPHSAAPSRGPPSPGGSVESERPYGEYSCELDETGATQQEQALALAWCKFSQPKNYLMATLKWVLQEQYTHEIEDPPDGTRLPIEVVNRRLVGANIKSRDLLTGIQQPLD